MFFNFNPIELFYSITLRFATNIFLSYGTTVRERKLRIDRKKFVEESCPFQGAKKLCPQCNMITSPSDLRRIYM